MILSWDSSDFRPFVQQQSARCYPTDLILVLLESLRYRILLHISQYRR